MTEESVYDLTAEVYRRGWCNTAKKLRWLPALFSVLSKVGTFKDAYGRRFVDVDCIYVRNVNIYWCDLSSVRQYRM